MKREKRKDKVRAAAAPKRRIDRRHALLGIAILLALLAYANSFHAPFLMDNAEILTDTRIHSATPDNVERIFRGGYHQASLTGLYRPLTSLSYMYNYAVRGDRANPAGYHWFNFFVHAVNIALVYALGLILFEDIGAALALAALWGVHPVLTEAVTNIVGRADMLAALGVLGALVAYHHSLRRSGAARIALIAAVALSTAIGGFSKESGVVAIAALIVFDQLFARERPWGSRIPGLLACAVPVAVFLIVRARVQATLPMAPFPFTDNPIVGAGFVEGRMTAFRVIGKYVGLLLWPAKLSSDYSFNEIPVAVEWKGVAGLLLCLAAAGAAVWSWRRARAVTFAVALFFIGIAPVANIFLVIGSIMGERFLYLPAVGFMAAIVYAGRGLWASAARFRTPVIAALAVALVALAGRAYSRNADWTEDARFWNSAVHAAPGSYKPHISLAAALPRNSPEAWQRILDETQRALAIVDRVPDDRNTAVPFRNAGVLYRGYAEYLALSRDFAGAEQWHRRALHYLMRSEWIEHKLDEQCRRINTRRGLPQTTYLPAVIYREMGIVYLRLSDTKNAIRVLEIGRSLESDPDLLENLAVAYGSEGDLRRAALALVEELEMDSSRSYLSDRLVGIYKNIDPSGCAVSKEGGAETLNVQCPLVHNDICAASKNVIGNYARRNQASEAAAIRRVATEDLGCAPSSLD